MAISGECLCGKVRYEISGRLFDSTHCHCSMCRRQHGALYATYADFDPADFGIDRGASEPAAEGGDVPF